MSKATGFYRWLAVFGVASWALFFFLLPSTLYPNDYETAEEQFQALAANPEDRHGYNALSLQVIGAVLIIPGVLGMVHVLLLKRRSVILGHLGAALALAGALAVLVAIGIEFAQLFLFSQEIDGQQKVNLALALNNSSLMGVFLGTGLLGIFGGKLLLLISFLWARVIPIWAVLPFALPFLIGLLPLSPAIANLIGGIGVLIPFLWMAWSMLRFSLGMQERHRLPVSELGSPAAIP